LRDTPYSQCPTDNGCGWRLYAVAIGVTLLATVLSTPASVARELGRFEVFASGIDLLDGNRAATGDRDYRRLSAAELVAVSIEDAGRQGVVADGVSPLLVRMRVPGDGTLHCTVEGENNGRCESLLVGPIGETGASSAPAPTHLAVAVYHPPKRFGPGAGAGGPRYRGEVEVRAVDLKLRFSPVQGPPQNARRRVVLARPPVVLVHGTFDNPENCWHTAGGGTASFAEAMSNAGFRTFAVDYRGSNGGNTSASFFQPQAPGDSTFEANADVVWANPGGIREALQYFRNDLELAATQADIVGHSLGGLLPRVFASRNYSKPAPVHAYNSKRNFGKGDIHRLITLCTPHRGSALPALMQTLQGVEFQRDGIVASALASGALFQSYWEGISAESGAVMDQIPDSPALRRIGDTGVPIHAIGCVGTVADASKSPMDPERTYLGTLENLAWMFYWAPELLERYLKDNGLEQEAFRLSAAIESIFAYWRARLDEQRVGWLTAPETRDTVLQAYRLPELLELFQHLIFLTDRSDFTVALASQLGGLGESQTTILTHILHSFAPRYPALQAEVIDILKSDRGFAEGIAPVVGDEPDPPQVEDEILTRLEAFTSDAYETGDEAIRWSGMVHNHPAKFLQVANREQALIMYRPVNHDATPLIAASAATKSMHIKPKSADWGPQRGYLAADQAFSKLAGKSPENIAKYNCQAFGNIQEGRADTRPLQVTRDGTDYGVYRYVNVSSGRLQDYGCVRNEKGEFVATDAFVQLLANRLPRGEKPPLFLRRDMPDGSVRFEPLSGETGLPPEALSQENMLPLRVFDHPQVDRYMTADYDFLAIAKKSEPCIPPEKMHPERGGICGWQIDVLNKLNAAARQGDCFYDNRTEVKLDLSHHGPENQFPKSPYVDYPITVIEPGEDNEPGRILAIHQGPEGYRDMHLKRYFARMIRRGWQLQPNPTAPGWNWGEIDQETGLYDERDQAEYPADGPPAEVTPPRDPSYRPGDECRLGPSEVGDADLHPSLERVFEPFSEEEIPLEERAGLSDSTENDMMFVKHVTREEALAEEAAFRLGRILGVNVPYAESHPRDDGEHAVIMRTVPGETLGDALPDQVSDALRRQYIRDKLLSALLGDPDRNPRNFILGPDGRLFAIDHGLAHTRGDAGDARVAQVGMIRQLNGLHREDDPGTRMGRAAAQRHMERIVELDRRLGVDADTVLQEWRALQGRLTAQAIDRVAALYGADADDVRATLSTRAGQLESAIQAAYRARGGAGDGGNE